MGASLATDTLGPQVVWMICGSVPEGFHVG